MALVIDTLQAFLRQWQDAPFEWGVSDCCMFAASWWERMTGTDAAGPWRGAYDSALGAQRLIDRSGGLDALVTQIIGAGAQVVALPGDVAVVSVSTGAREPTMAVGVMVSSTHIALRTTSGVGIWRAEPLTVWSCPKQC